MIRIRDLSHDLSQRGSTSTRPCAASRSSAGRASSTRCSARPAAARPRPALRRRAGAPDRGEIAIGDEVVYSIRARHLVVPPQPQHRHGVPVLRHLAAHDACSRTSPFRCGYKRPRPLARAQIRDKVQRRARRWCSSTGSRSARRRYLSGGQQQRLALARALVARAARAAARRAAVQSRRQAARGDAARAARAS